MSHNLRLNIIDWTQGNMKHEISAKLLVSNHWPNAHWNQFRQKSDLWAWNLAVQLAGIYEDDILSRVLPIMFLPSSQTKASIDIILHLF